MNRRSRSSAEAALRRLQRCLQCVPASEVALVPACVQVFVPTVGCVAEFCNRGALQLAKVSQGRGELISSLHEDGWRTALNSRNGSRSEGLAAGQILFG